jgi:hypothetical protein
MSMEIVNYYNNESDSFESNIKSKTDETLYEVYFDYIPDGLSVEFRIESYVLKFSAKYVNVISDTIIKFLDRFLFNEEEYSDFGDFYQVELNNRKLYTLTFATDYDSRFPCIVTLTDKEYQNTELFTRHYKMPEGNIAIIDPNYDLAYGVTIPTAELIDSFCRFLEKYYGDLLSHYPFLANDENYIDIINKIETFRNHLKIN